MYVRRLYTVERELRQPHGLATELVEGFRVLLRGETVGYTFFVKGTSA